jgi:hypothetical protein
MKRILALTIAVLGFARPGLAEDIRIDLSTSRGTTSGNWNNVSDLTGLTQNLIDFPTGAATNVSINGNGGPWRDFIGDSLGTFPDQDWLIQPATRDGAGLDDGETGTYTFANLTSSYYRVEVVTARTTFNYLNTITVNGLLANRTYLGTPVATPWGSESDGLTPGNWLIWDNVAAVNGVINLMDVADPNTLGMINAVRLVSVPEPGSFVLASLGAAFVLAAARSSRARRD